MARTPGPQDPAPHRPGPRRRDVTYAELHTRATRLAPRPARPGHRGAATASPTSAPTTPPPWRRCSPPAPSARSSSRSTPASPDPRSPTCSPTPAPGPRPRPRARRARRRTARPAPTSGPYVEVGAEYEQVLAEPPPAEPIDEPVTARRHLHDHVHLGHDRPPQGRDAHPRQHDLERASTVLVDLDLIADERALVSAPLFHIGRAEHARPCRCCSRAAPASWSTAFDPDATLDLIDEHRITFMFGVPTMFDADGPAARAGPTPTCPRCAS